MQPYSSTIHSFWSQFAALPVLTQVMMVIGCAGLIVASVLLLKDK